MKLKGMAVAAVLGMLLWTVPPPAASGEPGKPGDFEGRGFLPAVPAETAERQRSGDSGPLPAENIRITVVHSNDVHGWIMPRPAAFLTGNPSRLLGGAAAFAAWVKKVRGPKLVLDAGDWYQGTPEGALHDGRDVAEVFNAVGYDALTVGNHEFDAGEKNLEELISALRAPVVCANVYRGEGRRAPEFKPWIVKEVAGVKVGIFGLLLSGMQGLSFPENIAGLTFRRPVAEANDAVAALRREGATVIVALTHLGLETPGGPAFEGDQTLAAQVEGIDLIVGGHSHSVLKEGLRDATHDTLIVQAGSQLTRAGEVVLEIDPKTKKVVKSSARVVDLWLDQTGSDPAVAGAVGKLVEAVGRVYDVVVATAAAALTRNPDGESSLGDWVTDCSRSWAGADIALQNGGGIRADIAAGPVTMRDLFNVMPFDNRVAKLVLKGKDLKSVLDHGVGLARIAQISGAKVSYRRRAPEGRRLESVSIAGKALAEDGLYSVSTVDFLAKGGDGYAAFEFAESKEFTKMLLRDILKWCAQKDPVIKVPPAGRLAPIGD